MEWDPRKGLLYVRGAEEHREAAELQIAELPGG